MADSFEQAAQLENKMEVSRREMQRRSLDTLRILNPLDYPFRYQWDGFWHSVPAHGTKDVERYLANHYFKKISATIIGLQAQAFGDQLLKLREKQFGKSFIDKYEENKEVWDRAPRIDDPDLLKQILDTVIVGLVEEYGMDLPIEGAPDVPKVDMRSLHDQIFSKADKKIAPREAALDEVTKE